METFPPELLNDVISYLPYDIRQKSRRVAHQWNDLILEQERIRLKNHPAMTLVLNILKLLPLKFKFLNVEALMEHLLPIAEELYEYLMENGDNDPDIYHGIIHMFDKDLFTDYMEESYGENCYVTRGFNESLIGRVIEPWKKIVLMNRLLK